MADVGCAGLLVADTFCGPMRDLPREGQLLAVDSMPSRAGGCAANVAVDLAKQDFSVDVAGCLGNDASANVVLDCLEEHAVGCDHAVHVDGFPTSKTVILLVEGQDRRYIHTFGANAAFSAQHIDRDWLAGLGVFYLGGLGILPQLRSDELLDLLEFCRAKGVLTVVDVVVPQESTGIDGINALLPYVDFFLPNEDEARRITGQTDPLAQLRAFRASGADTVVITRGKLGAVAARGEDVWQIGTYQVQVSDPSGSGDAFTSGIITGALHHWDMPRTLRYASAIGASATRAVGTTDAVFTTRQAEAFIASNPLEISPIGPQP